MYSGNSLFPRRLLACLAGLAMSLAVTACGDDSSPGGNDDAGANDNQNTSLDANVYNDSEVLADASPKDAEADAWVRPPGDAFVLPDASGDAFVHPGTVWGPTMVINSMAISNTGVGLGIFGSAMNPGLSDAMAQGRLLMLMEFLDLDDLTGPIDATDVTVVIYRGADADDPPNPTNNFNGSGQFYVELATAIVIPGVEIVNGEVVIPAGTFQYLGVEIPDMGELVIMDPAIQFKVEDDFTGLSAGHMEGAVPSRTLDQLPNDTGFGNANGSMLDVIAASALFSVQPDVDIDGDGQLEEYFDVSSISPSSDQSISLCVDYFGQFEDDDCPQFPEIWDGYSVEMGFTAVPAEIVGSY